jgi:hypothetical protein
MTTFTVLLALAALAYLVAGLRMLRHDRPAATPRSHADWRAQWSGSDLPSRPYGRR